jgi:hypothetical protein
MESNFKQSEVIGYTYIDGRRVTVLKPGVKRKRYFDDIDPDRLESHINEIIVNQKKWEMYYKLIIGEDDFEN